MKSTRILVLISLMLFTPVVLEAHYINVDGDDSDWEGVEPAEDQFAYSAFEAIWNDAMGDDSGDGGDAPLAEDNPSGYTYPTDLQFLGTEADLLEFRATVDDHPDSSKIFILLRVEFDLSWMPYVGILMDMDNIPGSGQTDCGGFSGANLSDRNAWEYAVYIGDGKMSVKDAEWNEVPGYHSNYYSPENDLIEIGIDVVNFSPSPLGEIVFFTVFSGLQNYGNMRDVDYDATEWSGGGGLDNEFDPKIYDLAFVDSADQPNDLNNYTDTEIATIRESTVRAIDLSQIAPQEFRISKIYSLPFVRPGYLTWWKVALKNGDVSQVTVDRIRLDVDGPVSPSMTVWMGTIVLDPGEEETLWIDLPVPPVAPFGNYTLTSVAEYQGEELSSDSFQTEVVE